MNSNKKIILKKEIESPQQLQEIVSFLKPLLQPKTCFLLTGDLAAGKTTFVRLFCESFQITGAASPTFALHHVYSNHDLIIDHFDLYRLQIAEEVETSGVWEVLARSKSLVFIEWPSRIDLQDLPLDLKIFEIIFEKISETKRIISVYEFN
ncbi:MAG: tRNA (adenosine(37)-N6)-threonylcarbamoyltransferase complex ATPase subunit type 1 TsaE [Bdellovibrio sp.]|nr:tRNA (adenosine(37)-N6)-threonylcarbamoyltransferase complex ATPase subunit type 1 TsaE [Bdellovibrio sp.]